MKRIERPTHVDASTPTANRYTGSACSRCRTGKRSCDMRRPCDRCISLRCEDSCVDAVSKRRKLGDVSFVVKKACANCQKSKTKCSRQRPCTRCSDKGIACDLDTSGMAIAGPTSPMPMFDQVVLAQTDTSWNPFKHIMRVASGLLAPHYTFDPTRVEPRDDAWMNSFKFAAFPEDKMPGIITVEFIQNQAGAPVLPVRSFSSIMCDILGFSQEELTTLFGCDPNGSPISNIFPAVFKPSMRKIISWQDKVAMMTNVLRALYSPGIEFTGQITIHRNDGVDVPVKYVFQVILTRAGYLDSILYAALPVDQLTPIKS